MICNQCNRSITDEDVGLGFNAGYGPVYVCDTCAPPSTAAEFMAFFKDFIGMVEQQNNGDAL